MDMVVPLVCDPGLFMSPAELEMLGRLLADCRAEIDREIDRQRNMILQKISELQAEIDTKNEELAQKRKARSNIEEYVELHRQTGVDPESKEEIADLTAFIERLEFDLSELNKQLKPLRKQRKNLDENKGISLPTGNPAKKKLEEFITEYGLKVYGY